MEGWVEVKQCKRLRLLATAGTDNGRLAIQTVAYRSLWRNGWQRQVDEVEVFGIIGGDLSATHPAESGIAKGSGDRADKSSAGCAYTMHERRTGIDSKRLGETPTDLRGGNGSDGAVCNTGGAFFDNGIYSQQAVLACKKTYERTLICCAQFRFQERTGSRRTITTNGG